MLTGSVCWSLYDYQYNPAEARSCVLVSQLARIQTDSVADTLKELYSDIHLEIGENHPSLLPQGPVEALCLFLTTAAGISVNVYAISDNGQIRVELNNYYNILLALSNCFIIQVKKRVQTLLDWHLSEPPIISVAPLSFSLVHDNWWHQTISAQL